MAENKENRIQGFDPREFADNLTSQASEALPPELTKEDKEFCIQVIHKFCLMAGDALCQDTNLNFDADQASLVTQFIGEWTYHKSIDLVRGGIDINLREQILQKVAFTIFEIAKQAILKKMPQEQIIPLVEHHVNKCFKGCIEELKTKHIIDEETCKNTESQSNVDIMAQESAEEETQYVRDMSDQKILKLASLALLIKNLNSEKQELILSKFNSPEQTVLRDYLHMENLEAKIDPSITSRCLGEVKAIMPETKEISPKRCMFKLRKIIDHVGKENIINIMQQERPLIKNALDCAMTGDETEIPTSVLISLYNYIIEKVS